MSLTIPLNLYKPLTKPKLGSQYATKARLPSTIVCSSASEETTSSSQLKAFSAALALSSILLSTPALADISGLTPFKQSSLKLYAPDIAPALAINATTVGRFVGGYEPIKNVGESHVQAIAEFAISEHNKQASDTLKYVKVIKGWTQVVAGVNYKLIIEAKRNSAPNNYEAIVYERPWDDIRELTFFEPLLL